MPLPTGGQLWSPRQIAIAAFLGTPLAAGWLFSRNYEALSRLSDARRSLWYGLVATIGVAAIAFALPPKFPNPVLPAIYTYAIDRIASYCFGSTYAEHIAKGGAKGSWWVLTGIAFTSLLVMLALMTLMLYALAWWRRVHVDWSI